MVFLGYICCSIVNYVNYAVMVTNLQFLSALLIIAVPHMKQFMTIMTHNLLHWEVRTFWSWMVLKWVVLTPESLSSPMTMSFGNTTSSRGGQGAAKEAGQASAGRSSMRSFRDRKSPSSSSQSWIPIYPLSVCHDGLPISQNINLLRTRVIIDLDEFSISAGPTVLITYPCRRDDSCFYKQECEQPLRHSILQWNLPFSSEGQIKLILRDRVWAKNDEKCTATKTTFSSKRNPYLAKQRYREQQYREQASQRLRLRLQLRPQIQDMPKSKSHRQIKSAVLLFPSGITPFGLFTFTATGTLCSSIAASLARGTRSAVYSMESLTSASDVLFRTFQVLQWMKSKRGITHITCVGISTSCNWVLMMIAMLQNPKLLRQFCISRQQTLLQHRQRRNHRPRSPDFLQDFVFISDVDEIRKRVEKELPKVVGFVSCYGIFDDTRNGANGTTSENATNTAEEVPRNESWLARSSVSKYIYDKLQDISVGLYMETLFPTDETAHTEFPRFALDLLEQNEKSALPHSLFITASKKARKHGNDDSDDNDDDDNYTDSNHDNEAALLKHFNNDDNDKVRQHIVTRKEGTMVTPWAWQSPEERLETANIHECILEFLNQHMQVGGDE
mmetsp:Transcript_18302/g.52234  ORF Transcript_18302/g.52234 Transcript_18302/m.52234 type:complete len:615 (+) Transcript_18302:1310-3154(+)